nr:PREDICTED: annexin A4-like [Lepisosteus oculatus]
MAAIGSRGTVTEASGFNAEQDAQNLRAAMKGAGTDEEAIIKVLAKRTIAQRQLIKQAFKASVGKVKILYSRSDQRFMRLCCAEYGETLEDAVCSDTSGMFKRVLVSLLTAGRDESSNVDMAQAVQDAKDIYEAGEARWGTDEVKFLTVLCVRNKPHLLQALCFVVKCIRNKPAFFAERLYKSMKGLGTTDSILIRVMVSRAEIDMLDIKSEFRKMYGKTLYSFIKGDASGDYRKILLELCGGDN